jgi:hypothetical protein
LTTRERIVIYKEHSEETFQILKDTLQLKVGVKKISPAMWQDVQSRKMRRLVGTEGVPSGVNWRGI